MQLKGKILTLLVFLVSGCTSLSPQLGFKEVNEAVTKRSGSLIYWNKGTEEDKVIEGKVDQLLSSELTPDTATQIALLKNRKFQATLQELGIAQSDLVTAGLLPNPIIDGDIIFPKGGVSFELAVVQNFIGIFQIPLKQKIAESEFEETKIKVIKEALFLANQTRSTFFEVQALEKIIENNKTILQAIEASKDLAQKLHDAGNINELKLASEKSKSETLKVELSSFEDELILKREMLNVLLGLDSEHKVWRMAQNLPRSELTNINQNEAENKAISNSLDLALSRQKISTLITSLGYEEDFALFKDFELGVKGEKEPSGKWEFGPKFQIPIPIFNSGSATIFKANAELSQAYDLHADLEIKIKSRIRSLVMRLNNAANRLKSYENKILPLQEKLVSETQKHYNAMLVGAFDLLDAKHNQINSNNDYVKALKDYQLMIVEFESLLNGIFIEE